MAATGGYRIVNARSGLALTDGGSITQMPSGDEAEQVWSLVPHGSRDLVRNVGTGRFLTRSTRRTSTGRSVGSTTEHCGGGADGRRPPWGS
ncbi:RICIN domain-containing protein [Kutzneria kofuensis]|uniref:RICIN domain-containing protein n=1 Tax=Kutzneria kofuensis TaxID=103725 RepID=UPI001615E4CC